MTLLKTRLYFGWIIEQLTHTLIYSLCMTGHFLPSLAHVVGSPPPPSGGLLPAPALRCSLQLYYVF